MSLDSPRLPLLGQGPYTVDFYLERECPRCLAAFISGPYRTAVGTCDGLPVLLPALLEAKDPSVACPRCDRPLYLPPTALDTPED